MEDNNNTVNFDAVLSEMSALNKGVSASNEKLDQLIEMIAIESKNEQERYEKDQEDKIAAEQKKVAEDLEQGQNELDQEQQEAEAQEEVTETYTELLTDIRDELDYSNQLMIGQLFFIGVIFGVLIAKILIDRFMKL